MFIDKEWLKDQLANPQIRIVDCRFHLQQKELGRQQYNQDHIPGAVYFHLEKDLSSAVKEHGGRHPLPDLEDFKRTLEQAGIKNDDMIIAYDGGDVAFATRFMWMMKYVGHEQVFVLNGGYNQWKEAGFPTEQTVPTYLESSYQLNIQAQILAHYEEVKEYSQSPNDNKILIDSRDYNRYAGKEEPIDKRPGHIPNAINYPFMKGIENSCLLSKEKQQERFQNLDDKKEIIVYCGSGVTATPNYFALKEAGFENVKVYIGSYSDWVSYDDNPVEVEEA
ncbi:sulfurtransferase [Bacillus massiliigorillae]|uniref:sulfurtransferase n=1 Tax=Bacillus massiliigorillae TaxID=1243664 RepID=UPI00039F4CA4|nr:sulfurtransferase [Bacillus massiliigorillae]